MIHKLAQGKYLNGYNKVVVIVAVTDNPQFWYASNGFWYQLNGMKAITKPFKQSRPMRDESSKSNQDLDLSSFTPLSEFDKSKLFPGNAEYASPRKEPRSKNNNQKTTSRS